MVAGPGGGQVSPSALARITSVLGIGLAIVVMATAMTYGQEPSPVAWHLEIGNPRFVRADPVGFTADLVLANRGSGTASNIRILISYPEEIFFLTDLHRSPTGWLPFLGGLPVKKWEPGEVRALEFGFRFDWRTREKITSLLRDTKVKIAWTEDGKGRELELRLPAFNPTVESWSSYRR